MAIYKTLVKKASVPAEKKTKQKDYLKDGELPIIDQGQGLIGGYTNELDKKIDCSLPVIVFGDHTKNVKYINFEFAPGADGIKVLQPSSDIDPKYLFFGTLYLTYRLRDHGYARHYQYIEKMDLNVPGIEEQKQIVARIEELFSELDAGVETLRKTQGQLEIYRKAVLNQAFSGCETVTVSSVCETVSDGDHMPPPKAISGVPFIMISNIEDNAINWVNTAFVNREYYDSIDEKRKPRKGDVLYTVTGSYGIPILIEDEKEFCFQRHIALLRPNDKINQKFLYYAMMAPVVYTQAAKVATGTAQKTVGLTVLRKIKIPFAEDLSTQMNILSGIESKLSLCNNIESIICESLQQASAMRQSILKEAFEGGLL